MAKWEYLSVIADLGERDVWRPWKVNDEELPNWNKGQSLHEYLNRLGEEGWELVGLTYGGPDAASFMGRLVLKRQKGDCESERRVVLRPRRWSGARSRGRRRLLAA